MKRDDVRTWLQGLAEAEATVPARVVLDRLSVSDASSPVAVEGEVDTAESAPGSWRVQLWLVPSEVRLGVREVAEALGRSTSWIYKRTGPGAEDRIPHRRLDGELVFTAGELRAWIREREKVLVAGPMQPPALRAS